MKYKYIGKITRKYEPNNERICKGQKTEICSIFYYILPSFFLVQSEDAHSMSFYVEKAMNLVDGLIEPKKKNTPTGQTLLLERKTSLSTTI